VKKVFLIFSIIVTILILSVGIVDGLLALTNDINNHIWLSLIGRWESRENNYYEMEFHPDGTFCEYYYGVKKGSGNFHAYGNSIVINYDASSCKHTTENSCTKYMKLYFDIKTIMLVNNESKMFFQKVKGQ
jgi:hypothetical protein